MYAAVDNLGATYTAKRHEVRPHQGHRRDGRADNATGKVVWDHKFAQPAYGAATLTNDVAFTTTFDGTVWALSTKTGKVLWSAKLPAGTNTPVAVAGKTVITAGTFPQSKIQKAQIVAYRLPVVMSSTSTDHPLRKLVTFGCLAASWPSP